VNEYAILRFDQETVRHFAHWLIVVTSALDHIETINVNVGLCIPRLNLTLNRANAHKFANF